MQISALIITKNEEEAIEGCLKSVKDLVDEVIILDQNSTDKTLNIAQKYTANILNTNFQEFDKNRNILKDEAKGEWLLYLDSDERLTSGLKREIEDVIDKGKFSAFYIPRENYILGRRVKHGGWWPDYAPRLFRRSDLVGWQGSVHESPKIRGKFNYLEKPLIHITARNLNLMLKKSAKWAKIEAELFNKSHNPKVTKLKIIKSGIIEFLSRYLIKKGFLDGSIGLIEAIYQSFHKAMIFTYLWEIQNNSKEEFKKAKKEI